MLAAGPVGLHERSGIWSLSTLTGDIRKLADDGFIAAFSPDGKHVAYISGSDDRIWVMGPNGEQAHSVVGAGRDHTISEVAWSPDGTRLAYLKLASRDFYESVIESVDLRGGQPVRLVAQPRISAMAWATDGRVIYARGESPPRQESYGLWEQAVQPGTAGPNGDPRQIADWLSQSVGSITVSRDGVRVLLTRGRTRSNVYMGQFNPSHTALSGVRQLTQDDRVNWPSGWLADGRTVLFHADRTGNFDLFKQAISDREAQPLLLGPEEARSARLSPDRRWILYLSLGAPDAKTGTERVRLMRMPAGGGPSEPILETAGNWGRGESIAGVDGDYNWTFPDFQCAANARPALCIISEMNAPGRTVFTAFDPDTGRKGEVARADVATEWMGWDISPDGSKLAYVSYGYWVFPGNPVRVLTLADNRVRELPLGDWRNPTAIAWVPGGNVVVVNWSVRGGTLLALDGDGRTHVLVERAGKGQYLAAPRPSPDGRSLAFAQSTAGSNAWVLEARPK